MPHITLDTYYCTTCQSKSIKTHSLRVKLPLNFIQMPWHEVLTPTTCFQSRGSSSGADPHKIKMSDPEKNEVDGKQELDGDTALSSLGSLG